jgi:Txe/YoeB family toxin of Txe-Axe toxin-antitoxin module
MKIIFAPKALSDLAYWKKLGNKTIQNKITVLIKAIQQDPLRALANLSR